MFHRRKPGCQLTLVVAGQHRDADLRNHRPAIQFPGYKMYAGAMFTVSGIQRTLIGIRAPVQWQQGRVEVDHASLERVQNPGTNNAHETCQYDQVGIACADQHT